MTRDEALLQTIQKDLPYYHRQRMAKKQGEQMAALRAEQAKASPDPKVIEHCGKQWLRQSATKAMWQLLNVKFLNRCAGACGRACATKLLTSMIQLKQLERPSRS